MTATSARFLVVFASAGVGTRALVSLSVEEVCGVLHALDLGTYDAGARAHPVNGSVLAIVGDEDLKEVPRRICCLLRYWVSLMHYGSHIASRMLIAGRWPPLLMSGVDGSGAIIHFILE